MSLAFHFGGTKLGVGRKAWSTPKAEASAALKGALAPARKGGAAPDASFGEKAINRGREWVTAGMPYCGATNGSTDPLCNYQVCNRAGTAQNADWDLYRSDCSGFVSYAWNLPAPGLTTIGFAPYDDSASVVINIHDLAPGDALNAIDVQAKKGPKLITGPDDKPTMVQLHKGKPEEIRSRGHIMLFGGWTDTSDRTKLKARILEESQCGALAHEYEASFVEMADGTLFLNGDGRRFKAIRIRPELVANAANGTGQLLPSETGELRKIIR